jgi:hypothetical protein
MTNVNKKFPQIYLQQLFSQIVNLTPSVLML